MSDEIRGFISSYKSFLGGKEELRVNNMSGQGLIAVMTSNPDEPNNDEYIATMLLPIDEAVKLAQFILQEKVIFEYKQKAERKNETANQK